ncbi:MAG: NADH-quinone oxidoreductase subunit H, partial [Methanothrix sp.]|nr:NADH-quinone oxidoreductase subunit H [Methanothrix sp.]
MDGLIESITQFATEEPAIFALIIGVIGAALISAVINIGAMLVIWGERKVLGDFAARYGPNRVGGRWGILQLGADAIKFFTKEDVVPAEADRGVYVWAPIVASMATMLVAAAVPFGALHINGRDYPLVVADMDISAFYVEAALSIMSIGVFMAGYSSNNKYSMLGAFRGIALSLIHISEP